MHHRVCVISDVDLTGARPSFRVMYPRTSSLFQRIQQSSWCVSVVCARAGAYDRVQSRVSRLISSHLVSALLRLWFFLASSCPRNAANAMRCNATATGGGDRLLHKQRCCCLNRGRKSGRHVHVRTCHTFKKTPSIPLRKHYVGTINTCDKLPRPKKIKK